METPKPDLVELFMSCDCQDAGFEQNRLPSTQVLSGRSFELFAEGTAAPGVRLAFLNTGELRFTLQGADHHAASYDAVEVRPMVFFINWVHPGDRRISYSLILDEPAAYATFLQSVLPDPDRAEPNFFARIARLNDVSAVRAPIVGMGIGAPPARHTHAITTELLGKRLLCNYGTYVVEHVYLNPYFFCWHCIRGAAKGATDAVPCEYVRLGEGLYLLVWREKILSWTGVNVFDLQSMRSTGKVHYEKPTEPEAPPVHLYIGSHLTLLNETYYRID